MVLEDGVLSLMIHFKLDESMFRYFTICMYVPGFLDPCFYK